DMNVKTIFVRVTDPNGNSWEGARWDNANQVIGPNGTKEFLLNGTVPLGSPGIWQVANIEIEDSTYGWLGLNWNGHTKPSFTVTSSAPPPPPPPPNDGVKIVAGYTGGYATHEWQMVTFKDANGNPVQMEDAPYRLIANICSEIGPDPAHIDIKDKSRTGFQVRVEEDLAFDGIHNALEGICYIAISDNATYLTTRGYERITQLDPATWTTVPYGVSYGSIQPMAATIVSENGTESVHDDLNCGKTFCKMRIEEDLHLNGVHTQLEGVDWVVWANMPPGMQSGHQGSVTSFDGWKVTTFPQAFGVKPIVIARITSENGSDCVLADLKGITTTQFEVRLEECYPNDGVHANGERVSWMAVTPGVLEE
ncbi:hypothetical protein KC571_02620, partial [candidate division WWE3 bacterium]|nr:hypothetical protein [candidate division WWE3 bacterium]